MLIRMNTVYKINGHHSYFRAKRRKERKEARREAKEVVVEVAAEDEVAEVAVVEVVRIGKRKKEQRDQNMSRKPRMSPSHKLRKRFLEYPFSTDLKPFHKIFLRRCVFFSDSFAVI